MPASRRKNAESQATTVSVGAKAKSRRAATQAAGGPARALHDELTKAFGERRLTLKRSGLRPLAFDGVLIAEASSHTLGTRMWYEINLYRNDAGGYVAEIKLYMKPIEQKDICRVEAFADLEGLMTWLETYDPSDDAVVDLVTTDGDQPLATAALAAVRLRQMIDEARREFRFLVGELLYELGMTTEA